VARIAAILKALAVASWRAQRSAGSAASNNFFLMSVIFMQRNGTLLYVLVGLFVLFPLSADPLHRVPEERLGVLPLSQRERRWLRVLSPWVAPGSWIILAFGIAALRNVVAVDLLLLLTGLCAAAFAVSFLPPAERGGALRFVPSLGGRWGQLVRNGLRQILETLDFYIALLLAAGGAIYRFTAADVPDQMPEGVMLLVLLALSTHAQSLFGLDGPGGRVRYALLPLPGWQILAAKDAAFLLSAAVLTAPLNLIGGMAGALVALAFGHAPSVLNPRPQVRWRFASGAGLGNAVVQTMAMTGAGVLASREGWPALAGSAVLWLASLLWFGRVLERRGLSGG
jgi:hypothetical protein